MRKARSIIVWVLIATACGASGGASPGAAGGGGGGGGAGSGGSTGASADAIAFGGSLGLAYSPASLTVKVGDTVTWQGDFTTHPLVSGATCGHPDGLFATGTGTIFSFTFTAPGTYPYYCDVHCSLGMTGVVTVE